MQGSHDNSIAVPFSDDDKEKPSEVADDEDKPTDSPEERISRRAKRQARLDAMLREGKASAERVKQLEERDQQRERELAELRGMVTATRQQAAPPADGKDEFDRRLDAVYDKQRSAYTSAQAEIKSGAWNDERQRHYEGVAREIESEKSRIHAERVIASREPARQQEQARNLWVQRYPEVYGDQNAYQYAEATFRRRAALGEKVTNALVDEVMNEAITQFRLRPKPGPSANDRARFSGVPSSGSGGGSRSDAAGIQMTPELRRIATAAYSDLPEDEAIKKWVGKTGKRMRERKQL
jgi:hypothetical protein